MTYLDDMNVVGKLTPAAGAFWRLCVDNDRVRNIGLELRLPKCGIYGGDKQQVVAEAAKLRIGHQLDGFAAVGLPLESAEYFFTAQGRRAATVATMVESLVQLLLSVQSRSMLLQASLEARMAPKMQTVPQEARVTHMYRTDAAVWQAAAAVLDLPPGVGEYGADMEGHHDDKACSGLGRQLMLPLRHGGIGLHMQSDEGSNAAFVAGAGQAERNLKGRPAARPCLTRHRRWSTVVASMLKTCLVMTLADIARSNLIQGCLVTQGATLQAHKQQLCEPFIATILRRMTHSRRAPQPVRVHAS